MPGNVLFITRMKPNNAGNTALSSEALRLFQEFGYDSLRAFDRYPRYIESFDAPPADTPRDKAIAMFQEDAAKIAKKYSNDPGTALLPEAGPDDVVQVTGLNRQPSVLRQVKKAIALRKRLAGAGLIGDQELQSVLHTLKWANLIIWNPAGEFHPTGSVDQNYRLLLLMAVGQSMGAKLAFVNHSLEIDHAALSHIVSHMYSGASSVIIRDQKSYDFALSLGVPADRLNIAPDLVFLCAGRQSEIIPPENVPEGSIGLAVNALEAHKGGNDWDQLMEGLVATGRPLVYVSNAVRRDHGLAEKLAAQYGGLVFDRQPTYQELLTIFGRMDALISSRLHSSILSLCVGVPVVTIEPSVFKLTEVMRGSGFPIQTKQLGTPGWAQAVLDDINAILADKPGYRELSLAAAHGQAKETRAVYDCLRGLAAG